MKLRTKDLLTLNELSKNELLEIINNGIKLKKDLKRGIHKPLLKNKTLAMIFQKPSTRTRVSFETGMYQLGGHALNLSLDELRLKRGETIEATSKRIPETSSSRIAKRSRSRSERCRCCSYRYFCFNSSPNH